MFVMLQGYVITIGLHGETFINKAGITSSTFRSVPDEPVTNFEVGLPIDIQLVGMSSAHRPCRGMANRRSPKGTVFSPV
jgi:hypothetical protein